MKSPIQGVKESIQNSVVHTNSNVYTGMRVCELIGTFNNFLSMLK